MSRKPGRILEVLPNSRFVCEVEEAGAVYCHVSGEMRLQVVRLLPGATVSVEVSPLDPSKGRIVAATEARGRVES